MVEVQVDEKATGSERRSKFSAFQLALLLFAVESPIYDLFLFFPVYFWIRDMADIPRHPGGCHTGNSTPGNIFGSNLPAHMVGRERLYYLCLELVVVYLGGL